MSMKKVGLILTAIAVLLAVHVTPAHAIPCGSLWQLPGLGNVCDAGNTQPDLMSLINAIIGWITGIIGAVIVLVIIVSAIQLGASAGNPDAIKTAKNHIFNAVLGLVLLISMYGILRLIGIVN